MVHANIHLLLIISQFAVVDHMSSGVVVAFSLSIYYTNEQKFDKLHY